MKFLDDILKSRDGSYSLPKVAAALAHFNAMWMFVYLSMKNGYIDMLWATYLGATVFHATFNKWLASKRSQSSE